MFNKVLPVMRLARKSLRNESGNELGTDGELERVKERALKQCNEKRESKHEYGRKQIREEKGQPRSICREQTEAKLQGKGIDRFEGEKNKAKRKKKETIIRRRRIGQHKGNFDSAARFGLSAGVNEQHQKKSSQVGRTHPARKKGKQRSIEEYEHKI
ncbi:hypothetical protein B0H11DRAFT_1902560 [Mycena galericulata]|nr:hypothetical protein B0H11DRAFT_1902560 [Mycena galericulata]